MTTTFPRMASDELCERVARESGGVCILMFSRGKDAVGSWLQLRRYFERIVPVWCYLAPGLKFEMESIEYFEGWFGSHIIRLPHPAFYSMLNASLFQPEYRREIIDGLELPNYDFQDVQRVVREDLGLDEACPAAVGTRAADSPLRGVALRKNGGWNQKKLQFSPIWDWNADRLFTEIKQAGVKLPIDYQIWGRSFDGFDAAFTVGMRDQLPEDFALLKTYFPYIKADIKRQEYRNGIA